MNQPLSNEFLTDSSHHSIRPLHPSLKLALGVLDARLEDELVRYRRYRAGLSVPPSAINALNRSASAKALELPITDAFTQSKAVELPAVVSFSTAGSLTEDLTESDQVIDEAVTVDQMSRAMAAGLTTDSASIAAPSPMHPPLPPRTPLSFQNDLPEDASVALIVAAAQSDAIAEPEITGDRLSTAEVPLENFIADDEAVEYDFAPSDYLASSGELLRSLAEEEATAAAERNVLESLLTPFGVGSMLLMLLGSGMFGYLIMNPASLNAVKAAALKVATFRTGVNQSPTTSVGPDGSATMPNDANWQSNAPALDSNEFFDLSLNNISALRTRPGETTLIPESNPNGLPPLGGAQKSPSGDQNAGKTSTTKKANVVITGLTPPSRPAIARSSAPEVPSSPPQSVNQPFSGRAVAPVRRAPKVHAPSKPTIEYTPPNRAARASRTPSMAAPKPTAYVAPPVLEAPAPPLPAPSAPSALPELQGNYRIVTPYTNDAALEAAQKSDPNASFRNLDDGAYIQFGGAYGSQAEVESRASELRDQGFNVEIK